MDDTIQRLEQLETSMREHTHSTLDSTSPLAKEKPVVLIVATPSTVTPRFEEDCIDITALANAITIKNPTGYPYNFKKLLIRIKDNGTARAITWESNYVAGGFPLPSTTVLSKIMTCGFMYNTANGLNKWQLVGFAQET